MCVYVYERVYLRLPSSGTSIRNRLSYYILGLWIFASDLFMCDNNDHDDEGTHTHIHFQYVQENMIVLLSKMSKLSFVSNKIIFGDYWECMNTCIVVIIIKIIYIKGWDTWIWKQIVKRLNSLPFLLSLYVYIYFFDGGLHAK